MSGNKNFRVIVNMSNFYPDHRNRARIFINDEMQTIKDVEKKIKRIFDVKNFHLTSQNEFLPSSEDVRILQKDDIIWVMPNSALYKCSHFEPLVEQHKKTTKKSQKRSISPTINIGEKLQDEELWSPKKKKKKKIENVEHIKDTTDNEKFLQEKQKKKKNSYEEYDKLELKSIKDKNKSSKGKIDNDKQHEKLAEMVNNSADNNISNVTKKNGFMKINTLLPVLQSHINSYNQKLSLNKSDTLSSIPSEKEVTDKTIVNSRDVKKPDHRQSYLGNFNLSSYKKNVPLPTITDKYLAKKKINIIKIEYLSGNPNQIAKLEKQSKVDNFYSESNCKDLLENIEENEPKTVDKNSSVLNNLQQSTLVMDSVDIIRPAGKDVTELERTSSILMDIDGETENKDRVKSPPISLATASSTECQNENINGILYETSALNSSIDGCQSNKHINLESEPKNMPKKQNNSLVKNIGGLKQTSPIMKSLEEEIPVKDTESLKSLDITSTNNEGKSFIKSLQENEFAETKKSNLSLDHTNNSIKVVTEEKEIDANDFIAPPNDVNTSVNSGMDLSNISSSINMVDKILVCNRTSADANVSETNIAVTNDDNEIMFSNLVTDVSMEVSNILPQNTQNLNNTNNLTTNSSPKLDISDISKLSSESRSIFFKRKQQAGVGHILQDLRSNESAVSVESLDSDCSEFVTKRQRKRIRKRKKKNVVHDNTSLNESSLLSENYGPKPLKTKACPAIHIKFEEGENNFKIINMKNGSETKQEAELHAENITIVSETEDSNMEKFHIEEGDIMKSRSMKKLLPRLGDIIAFKRLRISENYTPEISSYITGKVIGFDSETKKVIYEILSGLDQCEDPEGKLSVGLDTENKEINNKLELAWIDVIDPRLLF